MVEYCLLELSPMAMATPSSLLPCLSPSQVLFAHPYNAMCHLYIMFPRGFTLDASLLVSGLPWVDSCTHMASAVYKLMTPET